MEVETMSTAVNNQIEEIKGEDKMTTLSEVKQAQNHWFDRGNKKFFGDRDYRVLHGKITGNPYLVRSTFAWSDMFGRPRKLSWRINPLDDNLIIQPLVDQEYRTIDDVKDWLRCN